MNKPKPLIAIVEDNPADVKLAKICTQHLLDELEIIFFRQGDELMQYLTNGHCDKDRFRLILMDLNMPGMDGIEVMQMVRKTSGLEQVNTVIFSSSENQKEIYRAYESGANAYVVKPIDFVDYEFRLMKMLSFWCGVPAQEPQPSIATNPENRDSFSNL